MKRPYFLGTAILAKHELNEVFNVLHSHVHELDDPIAFSTYEALEKKLELSQLLKLEHDSYPVRAIASQPIVDINTLPDYAAYKKLDEITDAIISGRALVLDRFSSAGSHLDDPHANESLEVWPLQIVFYNIGWYLGYECKVSEGTKRFPPNNIKMSKRLGISQQASKKMFVLPQTGDPNFPHCFQVTLPSWSVDDVDLRRWIVGFGGNIKVIQPPAIVEQIKAIGDAISHVYHSGIE